MALAGIIFIGLCAFTSAKEGPPSWHYHGSLGYQAWPSEFPNCGGFSQSPINVMHFHTQPIEMEPLYFYNYDEMPTNASISNNGHSLEVDMVLDNKPTLTGGFLNGEYAFVQYHLHWGANDLEGSEHTINHVRHPMEMHLVHYNTRYGSSAEAFNHPDGLVVLGIFFEISATDNPALAPLLAHIDSAHKNVGQQLVTDLYPLTSVLPNDLDRYYRYQGSLTTPPCNEVVTWILFQEILPVSEAQMNSIRSLFDADKEALVNNFRPPQNLNRRTVYRSFW